MPPETEKVFDAWAKALEHPDVKVAAEAAHKLVEHLFPITPQEVLLRKLRSHYAS